MNKILKWAIGAAVLCLAVWAIVVLTEQNSENAEDAVDPVIPPLPVTTESTEPLRPESSQRDELPENVSEAVETLEQTVADAKEEIEEFAQEVAVSEPQSSIPEQPQYTPAGPFAESDAVVAQETIKIDPPMSEIGRTWMEDGGERSNFSMPVSGGRDLEIEVERFVAIGENGGEFIGRVAGVPGSSVQLSYRGGAEAGTIRLPSENRVYQVLPGQGGEVVVQERNLAMDEPAESAPPLDLEIPPVPNFTPPPPPGGLSEPSDAGQATE